MIGVIFICMCLVSCAQGSRLKYRVVEQPEHRTTTVDLRGPAHASELTRLELAADGAVRTSLASAKDEDQTLKTTTTWSLGFAGLLTFAALVAFVARRWFPCVPSQLGMGLGGAAALFYVGPTLLDRYAGYAMIAIAVWGIWTAWAWKHNTRLKKANPEDENKDT